MDLFRQLAGVVRANLDYYGRWVTRAGLIAMPRPAREFWTLLPSAPAWARGRVSTPHGDLAVEWRQENGRIRAAIPNGEFFEFLKG